MFKRTLLTAPCALLVSVLAACADAPDTTSLEGADVQSPFSTTPGEPNHEEITAEALGFLRPELVLALQVANVATDVETALVSANHFDDCNFTGGAAVVAQSQAEAVAALAPGASSPENDALALRAFGRALHAVQDFYAHSNWVELGGDTLLDESLGAFPPLKPYTEVRSSRFVLVQGSKPKHVTLLTRDEAATYPENARVEVTLGKRKQALGLISGRVDYEPGDYCPDAVAMTHEELNKDKASLEDRTSQHEAAKALAVQQSRHEWCRLRALTRARYGEAGAERLNDWLAPGATDPCATASPSPRGPGAPPPPKP